VGIASDRQDSGRGAETGRTVNWGSATESLQQRLVDRFSDYHFGTSVERLQKIQSAIKDWKESGTKAALTSEDLAAPLLQEGTIKKKPSFIEMSDHLSTGVMARMRKKWRQRYTWSALYFFVVTAVVVGFWAKYVVNAPPTAVPPILNGGSYVVIWTTVITLTLLVWQWPSDHVMLTATLFLNICGLLNATEAWGAFSNSVVLSVAALSVVGDVVSHTGIIDIFFAKLLGDTTNLYAAMIKIFIPCAIGAASISNTCVMACSMPAVEDWCQKNGYHQALFFLPISYLMLIAGTFAVFSTSTNLVAQALLVNHNLPPLNTFELGYPACVNMVVGLFYLVFVTPIVLNRFMAQQKTKSGRFIEGSAKSRCFFVRVRVQLRLQKAKTIADSGLLDCCDADDIDYLERHGMMQEQPASATELHFDDILCLRCTTKGIEKLRACTGFLLLSHDSSELYATMQADTRELVEVILDQGSPLVGHRLAKAKTFSSYNGSVIAARLGAKAGKTEKVPGLDSPGKPAATKTLDASQWIAVGDQLVLDVPSGFCEQWRDSPDFVMLRKLVDKTSTKSDAKAFISGAILCVMLVFVATNMLDLFVCALSAIVALILTRCATPDSVKKAVRLNVVLTIVGAFGIGTAIGKHGIATALANLMVGLFSPFGDVGLLVAIWIVVVLLGIIFHGTAVVALMFPLCHQVAVQAGIPLHQMIAVLCYSVACQMLSPVSYNTNLMAYAACPEYRFGDFTKVGAPLCVILFCISIPMCRYFWPEVDLVPPATFI